MDLLARREHGRVELTRKLQRRGAPLELIDSALERLAEQGLLNETRYLEAFVASRARSGYGPMRIREQLTQRGLARDAVESAMNQAEVDWAEQLLQVWQRKFGQLPQDAKERAQQGRFLAYRGYSMAQISRLLSGKRWDD
jgi:regulatory protein